MLNSRPFGEVIHSIQQLGQEGNLACVLVQLNDTYFIDERPPRIPGMARVAAIVQTLRDEVLSSTGADNLLVLHSGDYLSPSSLNQKFHGQPMVDLLKLCGVRFATIGNHEFDFQKVDENIVWRRLADLHPCEHLLANLTPPPGRDIADVRFWPAGHPFIAITGLAGEQTIGKALKSGFSRKFDALELAVKDLMAKLDKHPEIRLFLVLSHMDRDEDKELEILLDKYWGHRGIAYILGGHDHDIDWTEFGPNVFLSKNLSNCKTMTVAVIRKDSLGSLYLKDLSLRLGLDIDQELALIDGRSRRSDREQAALIPAEVPIVLKQYIAAVRTSQPGNFTELPLSGDPPYTRQELMVFLLGFCRDRIGTIHHPDLHHAFERALSSYFATRGNDTFIEGIYTGEIVSDLVGIVIASASQDVGENLISLSPGLPVNELPTHVEATATVDFWKSQFAELAGPDREIAHFMVDEMDATDDSLRSRSTDFGNFIADAVKSASGAEVALLNSGAFRIDSRVSGRINLHMLYDTFVFDNVGSISLVRLSAEDLKAICTCATKMGGRGAFLQVSESHETLRSRTGTIEVALVTHMIEDDEDGFVTVLSRARGLKPNLVKAAIDARPVGSTMVDLITKGAPYVRYTNESRMIAVIAISPMENCALNFIGYVDAFVGERKRLNLREFEGLSILYAALSPLSAELAARDNAGDMKQLKQIASEAGRFLIEEMRKYHGSEHQHIGFLQAFTQELQKRSRLFWERDASYTT